MQRVLFDCDAPTLIFGSNRGEEVEVMQVSGIRSLGLLGWLAIIVVLANLLLTLANPGEPIAFVGTFAALLVFVAAALEASQGRWSSGAIIFVVWAIAALVELSVLRGRT